MKTVILCGGYGTRIRDVTEDLPKPMLPIAGRPILWHIMKHYAGFGFSEFVLCLGYKGKTIKDFFLNYEASTTDFTIELGSREPPAFHTAHQELGWTVTLAETGLTAMTGARVRRIRRYLAGETDFFLTYGDGVGDIDIGALLAFHRAHGRLLTVTGVRPPGRFGEIEHSEDGGVTGFNEKPQVTGGRISAGFFVCRQGLFDYLPERDDLVFETEPLRELVRDNQLMMFPHEGFWHPMDTHRDYQLLNTLAERGEAPWIKW